MGLTDKEKRLVNSTRTLNARFKDVQLLDLMAVGREAVRDRRREASLLVGRQRAALASQGIAIDSGTGLDVQAETEYVAELDNRRHLNNVARTAWGLLMSRKLGSLQGILAVQNAARRSNNNSGGFNF